MKYQNNKLDFTGQDIYAGIDVHKKSWMVTILTEEIEHKTYNMNPRIAELVNYLRKTFPKGNYICAYEAGFSGYWLHQELTQNSVKCIIVNAADVPQSDKDRRNKTDKVDSRRIAKALRNKQMEGIYIPKKEDIETRTLVRTRNMMVKDQTRCKNRIKSLLHFYGIEITEQWVQSYWSAGYIKRLEETELLGSTSKESLMILVEELKHLKKLIGQINIRMREISRSSEYINNINLLKSVPGIGLITAMVLLTEIVDINRFRRYDQLVSYAGLMPMEHSSGETIIKTKITPRCNSMLRHVLIESAWVATKKDPALTSAYKDYIKKGITGNRAIVKIARKLLCRIAHVLKTGESYSIAIVL
jgi:transposase